MKLRTDDRVIAFMPTNNNESEIRESLAESGGVLGLPEEAPVVYWRNDPHPDGCAQLTGNTRRRLCTEMNLPFRPNYVGRHFENFDEVLEFLAKEQDSRRSLTEPQRLARDILSGRTPIGFLRCDIDTMRAIVSHNRARAERIRDDNKYTFRMAINDWKRDTGQTKPRSDVPSNVKSSGECVYLGIAENDLSKAKEVYIGYTNDLRRRVLEHKKKPETAFRNVYVIEGASSAVESQLHEMYKELRIDASSKTFYKLTGDLKKFVVRVQQTRSVSV